jgi:hypothetical protein
VPSAAKVWGLHQIGATGKSRNHKGSSEYVKSPSRPSNQLVLSDRQGLGQIQVDLEAFFELSFWMAEELLELTARWSDRAAPKDGKHSTSSPGTRRPR